jgi:hypothetical protein
MTRADALTRAKHARGFVSAAEIITEFADEIGDEAVSTVVSSLAVLAGIAAADAICGVTLKQRSSSDDHAEAVRMLATVSPRGNDYARDLRRLVAAKSGVQYSPRLVSPAVARDLTKYARRLVDGMERELSGPTA